MVKNLKVGDIVKLRTGEMGEIIKYSSNLDMVMQEFSNSINPDEICHFIKPDISHIGESRGGEDIIWRELIHPHHNQLKLPL